MVKNILIGFIITITSVLFGFELSAQEINDEELVTLNYKQTDFDNTEIGRKKQLLVKLLRELYYEWDFIDSTEDPPRLIDGIITLEIAEGKIKRMSLTNKVLRCSYFNELVTPDSILYVSGNNSKLDSIMVPNRYLESGINDLIGKYILIEKYNNQSDVTVYDSVTVVDDTIHISGDENSITEVWIPSADMAQRAPKDMIVKVEANKQLPAKGVTGYFQIQDSIYVCGNDSAVTIVVAPSDSIANEPPQDKLVKMKRCHIDSIPEGMTDYYRYEIDGYGHFAVEKDTVEKVFLPDSVCMGKRTKRDSLLIWLAKDSPNLLKEFIYSRDTSKVKISDTLYVAQIRDSLAAALDSILFPFKYIAFGADSIIDSVFIVRKLTYRLGENDVKCYDELAYNILSFSNPVSMYLRGAMSEEFILSLRKHNWLDKLTSDLKTQLVEELNNIIAGESIYDKELFAVFHLSKDTHKLVRMKNPDALTLQKINRLLLAEAYPGYIEKPPQAFVRQKKGIPTWLLAALGYTTGFFLLRGTL